MILKSVFDMLETAREAIDMDYSEIRMCELGDQRMKWCKQNTGKKYFTHHNIKEHISLDRNGCRGALRYDLSKPIDEWQNYFDMTTDFGTAEHVNHGIYECFQNIHNFTRTGGVMIHTLPISGGWKGHSPYHVKDFFFVKLAELADYRSVLDEVRVLPACRGKVESLVCSILIKETDVPFITKDEFIGIDGIDGLQK